MDNDTFMALYNMIFNYERSEARHEWWDANVPGWEDRQIDREASRYVDESDVDTRDERW